MALEDGAECLYVFVAAELSHSAYVGHSFVEALARFKNATFVDELDYGLSGQRLKLFEQGGVAHGECAGHRLDGELLVAQVAVHYLFASRYEGCLLLVKGGGGGCRGEH